MAACWVPSVIRIICDLSQCPQWQSHSTLLIGRECLHAQVDTFEAVKTNVYSVLGDLAKDLDGPELDLLFSKFEACTGWPAPDTLKAMDLLKQLAKSDAKVRHIWISNLLNGGLEWLLMTRSSFKSCP